MFEQLPDSCRARFDDDGFVIVDRLIDPQRIPRLHQAFDDLFHGRFETNSSAGIGIHSFFKIALLARFNFNKLSYNLVILISITY